MKYLERTEVMIAGGKMAWPVPGYTGISSQYGMRIHPITGVYKLHSGVDIDAPYGASFVAADDGIVIKAEEDKTYGKVVEIKHSNGLNTIYAHGLQIVAKVGQNVKRGEEVLKVGSTGCSTGAHAHFEIRKDGEPINPLSYITRTKMLGKVKEK